VPGKEQCSNDTDMLQLQEPHPSNYRGCSNARKEMQKRKPQTAPKTTTGRVFSSNHNTPGLSFTAALRSNTQQQQQPHPPSVAQACSAALEAQPTSTK
jgi:hypothetical protein